MKLKELINITPACQVVTICNNKDEIILDGRLDDISIITDALGDIEILTAYSDSNCLDEDYLSIVLDTLVNQKDIFRAINYYFNTLSFEDMTVIVGEKMCCICREKYNK